MGRRKLGSTMAMCKRILPALRRESRGETEYPWQAPGTPTVVLQERREVLLRMNLVLNVALRTEWIALIAALDNVLQNEYGGSQAGSARSASSPCGSMSSAGRTDSRSASPSSCSMPPSLGGRSLSELDETRQKFVSEYLDDFVEPARVPSSPRRRTSVAYHRQSSVAAHCETPPTVELPSTEATLTEGCLPGTMPPISLFTSDDFSPSEERLARARDSAKRAPTLKLEGPVLTPTCTPMPPAPSVDPTDAERRVKSPRGDESDRLPAAKKHARVVHGSRPKAVVSRGSSHVKPSQVKPRQAKTNSPRRPRSALMPKQPKTTEASSPGRSKPATVKLSPARPSTGSTRGRELNQGVAAKQSSKIPSYAGRPLPVGVVPVMWRNPDVSIL